MSSDWYVGIDVSAKKFDVATKRAKEEAKPALCTFDNDAAGHQKLVKALGACSGVVYVALEATGTYGLDLALALDDAGPGIRVMVANPRAVQNFAKALLTRGKTDPGDAVVLAEFAQRMAFEPWKRPSVASLQLRALARRCEGLTKELVAEKNRLHAAKTSKVLPRALVNDIEANIKAIQDRIEKLEQAALAIIKNDQELAPKLELLLSIRGVGARTGIRLVAELNVLPEDMDVRQLVAHAGLDPRPYRSGTSVERRTKISKAGNRHLRNALYMPAIVAVRHEPAIKAYYEHLLAKGKKPLVAVVAVMRKLLHSIHGMWKTGQLFDGSRFFGAAAMQKNA